jgi:hypothetical protein
MLLPGNGILAPAVGTAVKKFDAEKPSAPATVASGKVLNIEESINGAR